MQLYVFPYGFHNIIQLQICSNSYPLKYFSAIFYFIKRKKHKNSGTFDKASKKQSFVGTIICTLRLLSSILFKSFSAFSALLRNYKVNQSLIFFRKTFQFYRCIINSDNRSSNKYKGTYMKEIIHTYHAIINWLTH